MSEFEKWWKEKVTELELSVGKDLEQLIKVIAETAWLKGEVSIMKKQMEKMK